MHIFFSGIGGTAIGPLALIAQQAGFEVSGSDKQASQYITYLQKHGLDRITIGQTKAAIAALHQRQPIDWLVCSSAIEKENPNHPELVFAREQGIRISKRDALLNLILDQKQLDLVAIAGTHGKSTTTAMVIWLLRCLGQPLSYSVGAKISFGDMGQYQPGSHYFVYEADEFDRNFLAFHPYLSIISGVTWDHHEIYPRRQDYQQAFRDFINQSQHTILWRREADYLELSPGPQLTIVDQPAPLKLAGEFNRQNAWLAIQAVQRLSGATVAELTLLMEQFPGLQRRMEQLAPSLYTDYAHTPEKIRGGMSVALEIAQQQHQKLVVVYEPLTNRRQHFMKNDYQDCFKGASQVYWVPSYLAREDPAQPILTPAELIQYLADPGLAQPMELNDQLWSVIQRHLAQGDMVVAMSGGGGHSLDEWLRHHVAYSSASSNLAL